jgi:hypothetical protein
LLLLHMLLALVHGGWLLTTKHKCLGRRSPCTWWRSHTITNG